MTDFKINNILLISFSGLVCFYYVLNLYLAYSIEAILLFVALIYKHKRLNFTPIFWYGLFFLYIFFDALVRDYNMLYVSSCLNVVVFILILMLLINNEDATISFIRYSGLWGVLFALFIFIKYQSILGQGRLGMELPGTRIESAITLGYIFLYIMCLQIYSLFKNETSKYEKFILIIGFGLSIYLTVLTGTRKALYIPIFYLLLTVYFKYSKSFSKMSIYFMALLFLGIFSFNYMVQEEIIDEQNLSRIQGSMGIFIDQYEIDDSTLEREQLASKAIDLFFQHPLLGCGIDYTLHVLTKHPHNNYLSILSMGGILMFVFYYWVYIYCLFSKKLNRKKNKLLFFIILFVLPLSDLGTTSFNIIYFNLFIALFVLAARIRYNRQI